MSEQVEKIQTKTNSGRYLCFSLGKDKFAIPLLQVKEVIANVETTNIPQAPAYFRGIMNLRGQVISVIDLRLKLKAGKADQTAETTIIILDLAPLSLGVVVDSVDSVTQYEQEDIGPTPDADSSVKINFIMGVARNKDSLTLLLDLKSALNANDFKTIHSAASKAA